MTQYLSDIKSKYNAITVSSLPLTVKDVIIYTLKGYHQIINHLK